MALIIISGETVQSRLVLTKSDAVNTGNHYPRQCEALRIPRFASLSWESAERWRDDRGARDRERREHEGPYVVWDTKATIAGRSGETHRAYWPSTSAIFDAQKMPAPLPMVNIPPPPRDLANDGCFIRYRRADAEAAAALCAALRAAGLPVWLDLTEIRGGDRFDEKIRRNVEAAAFFLPLLSANTCGKGGYFRKEWAWALAHNS